MLHNATLVHDDLQDGDLVRRGQMTVWNRFGVPQAINLGDAMFYFAVLLCQRVDTPVPRREALARRLLLATLKVIDGQEREFGLKGRGNVSLDDYCTMVEGKTSGLFALPMAGAAELCGAPTELVAGLEEAARHLGVLFQIQDDTLDLYGDKGRELRGSDIAEGKRSVLVVHALEHASEDDARWLLGVLDKERTKTSRDEIAEASRLLQATGSFSFALDEIERRRQSASAVPAVAAHESLHSLIVGMGDLFLKPIEPLLNR
jgi:geranylgeranyl pyrophosphate synthase